MVKRPVIHSSRVWGSLKVTLAFSIVVTMCALLYAIVVLVPELSSRLNQQTIGSKQANSKLVANGLSSVGPNPDKIKAGDASAVPTNEAPITPAPTYIGVTGPAGASGPPGGQGTSGERGKTGPSGPRGEPGPSGPSGPTGKRGTSGAAGEMGAVGATGVAGIVGPSGAIGPAGPSGAQGIQGPAGQDGQNGQDGADGQDGTNGKDAPVFVSDQVTNNGDGTCFDTWTLSDGSTITTNNYGCSPAPTSTAPTPSP